MMTRSRACLFGAVALASLVLVRLLAAAGEAPARKASRRSILTTERINLTGALQRVAHAFFKPPRGTVLSVVKQHDHWRTHEGVAFEKYEVSLAKRGVLGSFLRMRCFPGGDSTVDLALRLERDRIVACEPIQPVIIRGTPLLALPQLLLLLEAHEVSSFATTLSRVFQSLVHLEVASAGEDPPTISRAEAEALGQWIRAGNAPLKVGDAMPDFELKDEGGRPVSATRLRARRSLVVMGTLMDERCRQVLEWLHAYIARNPDRFVTLEVMMNRRPVIDLYRDRGGTFAGTLVPDFEQKLYQTLHGVFTPCIHVFDGGGKLARLLEPVDLTGYDALARELDAIR